jgi:hypothetical protein
MYKNMIKINARCAMKEIIVVLISHLKKEFQPNGLFETINLPIKESQKIPIKLVNYIYPKNWNEENDYVPFHNVYYIKRHLNTYCT